MGESAPQSEEIKREEPKRERLMYLDFVATAAAQAVVCLTSLYDFAKENAGPLKSGVQSVEDTVKAVVSPVFDKFHDVPFELLKFVDRKESSGRHESNPFATRAVRIYLCEVRETLARACGIPYEKKKRKHPPSFSSSTKKDKKKKPCGHAYNCRFVTTV